LASALFRLGGGKDGIWGVDDTGMSLTWCIVAHKDQRGVIGDNDFISNRLFGTDWSGDLSVTSNKEQVVWASRDVQYTCRPPYWEFKGKQNGIEFDLKANALGHATFWKGNWEELNSYGGAGFGQAVEFNGTIKIKGKTYPIKNALGCRDKLIHKHDLVDVYHSGKLAYYWIWCLDPALRAMIYHVPGVRTHSEVNARGEEMTFNDGTTEITPMDLWVDPRTGVQVPTRWHLAMESSVGKADITIQGGHRALYGFLTRSGVSLQVGFLARANGHFTSADGEVTKIVESQSYVEWGRALFPLASGR
jgi:hypothetical protein